MFGCEYQSDEGLSKGPLPRPADFLHFGTKVRGRFMKGLGDFLFKGKLTHRL